MKVAKNVSRLGTETAFKVLAEAKKLEKKGKQMVCLFRYKIFSNRRR